MKKLHCDSCQAVMINGVFCHEKGCPKSYENTVRKCKNCHKEFKPKTREQDCCSKGCSREYWNL